MDIFDLLVVFKDGSEMVIEGVSDYGLRDYGIKKDENVLRVTKNDWHQFFNWNEVKYCGRLSDLRQQEN